jgi:hypothetical protein
MASSTWASSAPTRAAATSPIRLPADQLYRKSPAEISWPMDPCKCLPPFRSSTAPRSKAIALASCFRRDASIAERTGDIEKRPGPDCTLEEHERYV